MPLISYLTDIHFDFGVASLLKDELSRMSIRSPLLVTDRGVIAAGIFDRVTGNLAKQSADRIFDATPPNPTESAVKDAAAQYHAASCDGIIAIGGGSPIDLAKAVAVLATHGGILGDYVAVSGGSARITPATAPVIAIPTTAGSGSEVGRAALIVLEDRRKLAIISPHLFPKSALCDPELTLSMPASLTAGTGMDAISHCVETFLSPRINPPADAMALDGLRRGVANIEKACADGSIRQARWEMMMASVEGGLAFQKGLGAVHAMSHPLGTLRELAFHHGTLNAVLLPHVLRFNRDFVGDKYARIADALSLPGPTDLPGYFAQLNSRIGLPESLSAMGVSRSVLSEMARMAVKDLTSQTNPLKAGEVEYLSLLNAAF